MKTFGDFMTRFARDEAGSTAIEYALMVSMIFLAIVSAIELFTSNTNTMYNDLEAALSPALTK